MAEPTQARVRIPLDDLHDYLARTGQMIVGSIVSATGERTALLGPRDMLKCGLPGNCRTGECGACQRDRVAIECLRSVRHRVRLTNQGFEWAQGEGGDDGH